MTNNITAWTWRQNLKYFFRNIVISKNQYKRLLDNYLCLCFWLYTSFHFEGKTEGLSAAGLRDAAPGKFKVIIATLKEINKIKVVTITSVVYISLCRWCAVLVHHTTDACLITAGNEILKAVSKNLRIKICQDLSWDTFIWLILDLIFQCIFEIWS